MALLLLKDRHMRDAFARLAHQRGWDLRPEWASPEAEFDGGTRVLPSLARRPLPALKGSAEDVCRLVEEHYEHLSAFGGLAIRYEEDEAATVEDARREVVGVADDDREVLRHGIEARRDRYWSLALVVGMVLLLVLACAGGPMMALAGLSRVLGSVALLGVLGSILVLSWRAVGLRMHESLIVDPPRQSPAERARRMMRRERRRNKTPEQAEVDLWWLFGKLSAGLLVALLAYHFLVIPLYGGRGAAGSRTLWWLSAATFAFGALYGSVLLLRPVREFVYPARAAALTAAALLALGASFSILYLLSALF